MGSVTIKISNFDPYHIVQFLPKFEPTKTKNLSWGVCLLSKSDMATNGLQKTQDFHVIACLSIPHGGILGSDFSQPKQANRFQTSIVLF